MKTTKKFVTVAEGSLLSKIPARTLRMWCKIGYIDSVRCGNIYLIKVASLKKAKRRKRGPHVDDTLQAALADMLKTKLGLPSTTNEMESTQ